MDPPAVRAPADLTRPQAWRRWSLTDFTGPGLNSMSLLAGLGLVAAVLVVNIGVVVGGLLRVLVVGVGVVVGAVTLLMTLKTILDWLLDRRDERASL